MATGTRKCKVCGKVYKYCKNYHDTGVFRYKDVACSPECGAIYFERIQASRCEESEDKSDRIIDVSESNWSHDKELNNEKVEISEKKSDIENEEFRQES